MKRLDEEPRHATNHQTTADRSVDCGVLGLALALGAIRILRAVGSADLPRFGTQSIDTNVFLFAAACVLFVAVTVRFAPALRVSRGDLSTLINSGGRFAAAASGRNRLFSALVVA